MTVRGVVPMKPHCRHCGTTVARLQRCPKCGRRNWLWFIASPWMRH
jgi:hypothetical protein